MIGRGLDLPATRWVIGVALPIAMILLDPAVFRCRVFGVGMPGTPIFGTVKPFAYVATAIAVLILASWLTRTGPSWFASGAFAGGAVFAMLLGLALLPFSLIGILMFGIGLLGLTPFLMAAVYARAAYMARGRNGPASRNVALLTLGMLTVLGAPAVVQTAASRAVKRSVVEITSGEPLATQRGVTRLRRWAFLVDLDRLLDEYVGEHDPGRQARLAAAYQELTGYDAASRALQRTD